MSQSQRYVSDELTHFLGRGLEEEGQYSVLSKILREGKLIHPAKAGGFSGLTITKGRMSLNETFAADMICFCDIPLGDLGLHARKYSRFGIAFPKGFMVKSGANPVFYVARSSVGTLPGHSIKVIKRARDHRHLVKYAPRAKIFDDAIDRALGQGRLALHLLKEHKDSLTDKDVKEFIKWFPEFEYFSHFHIFAFVKFFDDSLPEDSPHNYYMEREWRVLGNLQFKPADIARIIIPESFAKRFRTDFPRYEGQLHFL